MATIPTVTCGTLVTRISARLKDPQFTAVPKSEVVAVINDVIEFYQNTRLSFNEFKEVIALVPGQMEVPDLVTNTNPELIFNTNGMVIDYSNAKWPLTKASSEEIDAMDVQGQGMPYAWTWRNGQFVVYYKPDQAYNLIVRGLETYAPLVNDGDNNDFTNNASKLLMNGVLSRLYAQYRQDDKMEGYYTAAEATELKDLKAKSRKLLTTNRIQVREI